MPDTPASSAVLPFWCCAHCACPNGERIGHDDACSHGCNDNGETDEVLADELATRLAGEFQSESTAQMLAGELVREGWRRD